MNRSHSLKGRVKELERRLFPQSRDREWINTWEEYKFQQRPMRDWNHASAPASFRFRFKHLLDRLERIQKGQGAKPRQAAPNDSVRPRVVLNPKGGGVTVQKFLSLYRSHLREVYGPNLETAPPDVLDAYCRSIGGSRTGPRGGPQEHPTVGHARGRLEGVG